MPTLNWKGQSYEIPPTTIGSAKKVALARKQLRAAQDANDGEASIESVGTLLGLMGCPQEVAEECPIVEIMGLVKALADAQAVEPAIGGGGTGNAPNPPAGESSTSTTP